MAVRKLPSPNLESVRRQFSYDPETGALIRKRLGRLMAGRMVLVDRIEYRKSRICCLIETGEWPDEVDHEDTNELNDKWSNLRKCSHQQNLCNRRIAKSNKLGVKGVVRCGKKFRAKIASNGVIKRKVFDTIGEAADAYMVWSQALHGEYGRV